jgi:hypothetical protein
MRLGKELTKKLDEMSEYFSMKGSEVIRNALNVYYGKNYRVDRFGQQSGNRTRKETQINELEKCDKLFKTGTDDEINEYLRSIGFFKIFDEKFEATTKIGTLNNTKGMILYYNNGTEPLLYDPDMQNIKDEVIKFLTPPK